MPFENRLKKNYKHRKKWASKNNLEAYRLYERDIPDFPHIIDIYKQYAVIYWRPKKIDFEDKKQEHNKIVQQALINIGFPLENQIVKLREVQKGKGQYEKLGKESLKISIQEGPVNYVCNLTDYLDTGLFLDHRPLRRMIFEESYQKSFLNLFSYTCSVSVMAAIGGGQCTSVDMSNSYLEWGKENFRLNQLDPHEHHFIKKNVLDFLQEEQKQYELIFLDPPTFSNSKKMENDFDVERDQEELLALVFQRLAPGGTLFFSNNKRDFKFKESVKAQYSIEDLSNQSFDLDFRDKKLHHLYKLIRD
jgi:23S rRNA (cytosine1962-C5)-methyltransferase